MEGVSGSLTLHESGQLQGFGHRQGLIRGEGVVAHALHQVQVVGQVRPHREPIPGRDVGVGGETPLDEGELGRGDLPLDHLVPQGGEGDHCIGAPGCEHQGVQTVHLVGADGVIDKGEKLLGGAALLIGEGEHAHHPPLVALLSQVQAIAQVFQRVVLRLEQIGAVLPDEAHLVVDAHQSRAQGEVQHRLVLNGDDHLAGGIGKAPQAVFTGLGQALLVAVDGGGGQGAGQGHGQGQDQGRQATELTASFHAEHLAFRRGRDRI